jgi:hypothetical protein
VALDPSDALDALAALVGGLAGVTTVYVGVPESLGPRVSAYVALADAAADDKATGLLRVTLTLLVVFGYRVDGAEADAERVVADLAGAFWAAYYADRNLGGKLVEGRPAPSVSAGPEYTIVAGQEFRRLPLAIMGAQLASYQNVGQS